MRSEPFVPPATIEISTTAARAHLSELLQLMSRHGCKVVLIYKGIPTYRMVHVGPAADTALISPRLWRALSRTRRLDRPAERKRTHRRKKEAVSR
jgi:hypothetical protein